MTAPVSTPVRLLAMITLVAFFSTATLPYYCSTGWCGGMHSKQKVAEKPGCCASESAKSVRTTQDEGSCCGGRTATPCSDKSGDRGCATSCCKIAAGHFVFSPAPAISLLTPISILEFVNPANTGIELTDCLPQPPRVLSA